MKNFLRFYCQKIVRPGFALGLDLTGLPYFNLKLTYFNLKITKLILIPPRGASWSARKRQQVAQSQPKVERELFSNLSQRLRVRLSCFSRPCTVFLMSLVSKAKVFTLLPPFQVICSTSQKWRNNILTYSHVST